MNEKYLKLYDKFIELYGTDNEIMMCIEEASELSLALCKYLRFRGTEKEASVLENVREEIADALNTVEQMQNIFGKDEIEKIRVEKFKRALGDEFDNLV